MAETRLTDVIVPEVFTSYTFEPFYKRSRYFRSGVMAANSTLNALLNGGGEQFNFPFWQPLSGGSEIPVEASAQTINNITAAKQIARRQLRTKAWGTNNIVTVETGDDPLNLLANQVTDYWTQEYDLNAIKSTLGVYADNVANDSGDLVYDGSAASFNDDGVISAMGTLGENGVIGRSDSTEFVGIAVHSTIYNTMQKNDLIDTIAVSDQVRPIELYRGMEVIVDDNMPIISTSPNVYLTVIYKSGALQFGQSSSGYEPTSVDRVEDQGFGIDQVFTRRVFGIQPVGTAWQEASVAGTSPTDTELAAAANWDRVYNQQNMGMVFYSSLA